VLADVQPGHGVRAGQGAGVDGAGVGVPGRAYGGDGARVDRAVRVAEAVDLSSGQLRQQGPAVGDLGLQGDVVGLGEIDVREPVRADLHALGGREPHAVRGQQRLARAERIPGVEAAEPSGQDEQGGTALPAAQRRKGVDEEVGVSVVEGETDQPPARAPGPGGEQLAQGHPPQPAPVQPGQLLLQPLGGDRDAVRVVGAVAHGVVHRHPRDRAGAPTGASAGVDGFNSSGHASAFA